MSESKSFVLLQAGFLHHFFFFYYFPLVTLVGKAQQDQILTTCGDTNYTSGSQYETNLKDLLPPLATNAVRNIDTYYSTSVGTDPDRIYGYAQCMSASTADACGACLNKSISTDVDERCPNMRRVTIRYYSCIIRFSDRRFSSEYDGSLIVSGSNQVNANQPGVFNAQLGSLLKNLTNDAAFNSSRLAWGRTSYNYSSTLTGDEFPEVYGVVQCTGDLPPNQCSSCLQGTIAYIPTCCENKTGGLIYFPSCSIRFSPSPFYPASRLPPPPPPPPTLPVSPSSPPSPTSGRRIILIVLLTAFAFICLLSCALYWWMRHRRKKTKQKVTQFSVDDLVPHNSTNALGSVEGVADNRDGNPELPVIHLHIIQAATNNFSAANKLGQGGFGPVYKGALPDGKIVAVKRLKSDSGQGIEEFKNEIKLIVKLQHRNLVRLWGCCLEKDEKLLVYEYMPNTSLDVFLFDPTKKCELDWQRRLHIINGVARGLLYLHEDSRLRVIHRDLKASNVLLDHEMNAKISDFGLARIFGGDETDQANTRRVVGTYGYMAPEYAMAGLFSVKSDVFSFGVLLLEILSGKKNSSCHFSGHLSGLHALAWNLWNENRELELLDPVIADSCSPAEALRCIHIGLLCVQEDPAERPSMSAVVLMLGSDTISLPKPRQPGFHIGKVVSEAHRPSPTPAAYSLNEVTLTEVEPR